MRLQVKEVYHADQKFVKRFVKLLKKDKFVRKYETIFTNDEISEKTFEEFKKMFRLVNVKEDIDFDIL